jgi:hypothetical protein
MKTAVDEAVYGAANMIANKCMEFQVGLFDAEPEATTSSIADTDSIVC